MYIDGIKQETPEENQAELERIQKYAEEWGLPHMAYKGPTNDIDILCDWYCPQCADGTKLMLDRALTELYCPNHYEVCEYTFRNKEHRGTSWWSEGFLLPLSPTKYRDHQLATIEAGIKCAKNRIKYCRKHIKELEAKREALLSGKEEH